jgi:NAD-dependent SIR2 family protein deacetylase
MFSGTQTMKSTENCLPQTELLANELREADAVVIGAGAGLSYSAGFTYSGERFEANFTDFIAKYHFTDMYTAGFYPFESPEEQWAYWSRHIWYNRYVPAPKPVYDNLLKLVRDKDYFVLTTNVDHQFQKAGFDKRRLFYTQGDYGLWQCSVPCHQKTYDNEETVRKMMELQADMRVPTELVPRCPVCGKPMTMNLRADDTFVEDAGWQQAQKRYGEFLRGHQRGRVLYLELGVGFNTPGIIKVPFWRMTAANRQARLVSINPQDSGVPEEIAARSLCISADIGNVLDDLIIRR